MAAGSPRQNRTVLVVDDDPIVRQALGRILELEGFSVQTAGSIEEAGALLDGQHAVLLDLNLPDGLGTTLLRAVRSMHHGTRVAVLTGAGTDLVEQVRRMGPDRLMRKPIDLPSLLAWLRE